MNKASVQNGVMSRNLLYNLEKWIRVRFEKLEKGKIYLYSMERNGRRYE